MRVLVDKKLDGNLQLRRPTVPLAAGEEGWPLLLCHFEAHLDYCIQVWDLQHRKDRDFLEQVQRRTTSMIKVLEYFSYKERLREFIWWRDLIATFHYLKVKRKKTNCIHGLLVIE